MKTIIRLWDLLRLMLRDSRVRRSVKELLYFLTRLEEMHPDNFSPGIGEWKRRIATLQAYLYRAPQLSHLPNDLSLLDDYRQIAERIKTEIASFPLQPLISLIVPIYGEDGLIESTLKSIQQQLYSRLEVYLLVNAEHRVELERASASVFQGTQQVMLKQFADLDANLESAFNQVLSECHGEWIGFVSSADTITRDAALEVVRRINQCPNVEIIYSDEGKKAGENNLQSFHKPGWSPDLFSSLNYTQNFLCCRKESIVVAGGFRGKFEADLKYDLVLRVTDSAERVQHIPRVLYYEEALKTFPREFNADKVHQMEQQALETRLRRLGVEAKVSAGITKGSFRVRRPISADAKVSIIIPTRDKIDLLKRCIDSIETRSTFRNYEIIIIDNGSVEMASAEYFAQTQQKVIAHHDKFNYSTLNNIGARNATGEHLLFLNNDTEVIAPDWLEALLEHSQRAEVGAVGAKLLYPNGMIQHAGMVFGGRLAVDHVHRLTQSGENGYHGLAAVVRNFNSVTGACLMMRADVFKEIGGFDERLAVTYNDIDLCLKTRALDYLVVYTPYAVLYHHEGVSVLRNDESETVTIETTSNGKSIMCDLKVPKGQANEVELFYTRWKWFIENDLNFNPNLAIEDRC